MAGKAAKGIWSGIGITVGTALIFSRLLRLKRAARWRREWQSNQPGMALVTGASSGIGEVYARRLAQKGFDLVLVARRAEKLEELAQDIRQRSGVQVEVLPADLADDQGITTVESRLSRRDVSFLVNNAGFGIPGTFADIPIQQAEAMISVHILASVRLTKAALPAMLERGRGAIVNVSSTAAFINIPGDATYGPTKAYLNSFTESLGLSLGGSGIRLQALCPGFTVTGFHGTERYTGVDVHAKIPSFLWQQPEAVVDESLRCLEKGELICIPGRINQLIAFFGRTGIAQIFINLVSLTDPGLIRSLRGWNK